MRYIPGEDWSGIDTIYLTEPLTLARTGGKSVDTSSFAGGTHDGTGDPGSRVPRVRCLRHTPGPMQRCSILS